MGRRRHGTRGQVRLRIQRCPKHRHRQPASQPAWAPHLDGIVCILLGPKLHKAVALVLVCDAVLGQVHIHCTGGAHSSRVGVKGGHARVTPAGDGAPGGSRWMFPPQPGRGSCARRLTHGAGLHKQLPNELLVGLGIDVPHVASGLLVAVSRVDANQVRAHARRDAAAGGRHGGGAWRALPQYSGLRQALTAPHSPVDSRLLGHGRWTNAVRWAGMHALPRCHESFAAVQAGGASPKTPGGVMARSLWAGNAVGAPGPQRLVSRVDL